MLTDLWPHRTPLCARVHNLQESLHPSPPLSRFSSSFYDRRGLGMHAGWRPPLESGALPWRQGAEDPARIPPPSATVANTGCTTSADVTSRHITLPLMPHLLQRQGGQEGGLQV